MRRTFIALMLLANLHSVPAFAHGVDMFDTYYGAPNQITPQNHTRGDVFASTDIYPGKGDLFRTPHVLPSTGGDVFGSSHRSNGYSEDVFYTRRISPPADPLFYWDGAPNR
jgi:hypothetical protein